MTQTEHENASKYKRLQYRLYRNPVVLFGLGALFLFLKCYDAVPSLQAKSPLTIMQSFHSVCLKLWDEEQRKMVSFPWGGNIAIYYKYLHDYFLFGIIPTGIMKLGIIPIYIKEGTHEQLVFFRHSQK